MQHQELPEHEEIPSDRHHAMNADPTVRGRPGKHQDPIQRHELFGPDQAGQAKEKVQLHDEAENQVFHISRNFGESTVIIVDGRGRSKGNSAIRLNQPACAASKTRGVLNMQRILLLASFLLLSLGVVAAQDKSGSADPSSGKDQTTLRGCLRGAPSAFTLTADDGTIYQLIGDNGQLGHLVGKEIMVNGRPTSAAMPTGNAEPSGTNPASGPSPNFTVTSAKKVSDQCGK